MFKSLKKNMELNSQVNDYFFFLVFLFFIIKTIIVIVGDMYENWFGFRS